MGLLPKDAAEVQGQVRFDGVDLVGLPDAQLRDLRGDRLAMIFQEPMTSLNPAYTIGEQISEVLVRHRGLSQDAARDKTIQLLRDVRIPSPEQRVDEYPHKLSGGMRQRVMIAMALACKPKLIIADEPTTALDVTIQAQILDLMRGLKEKTGAAFVLITHDLCVVAEMAQRVIVMYAGRKVEEAVVGELFARPMHPYTRGLLSSIPRLDLLRGANEETDRLQEIPGIVPPLFALPEGCAFAPRCPRAIDKCRIERPSYEQKAPGHWAACWHPHGG
jgi:peptide/nickel transport system ATP-binding protein